jgi:hypothetical protein
MPDDYITLKEYVDTRFDAVDIRFAANEKDKELAKDSMEYRLDSMNEFRNALRDTSNNQVTKAEYCAWKTSVEEDIRSLRESRSLLEGKATQSSVNNVIILSVVSLLISLVSILLKLAGL